MKILDLHKIRLTIEYKSDCDCRKPKPGLLLKAAEYFNIDLSQSIMIGDSSRDIEAGEIAGCKECCLITPQYSLLNYIQKL